MSRPAKILSLALIILISGVSFWHWPTKSELQTITVGGQEFKVEIADTEAKREQGLSGRASLPPGEGMLFEFAADTKPAFWMKEMNFPLDIAWLDPDFKIIGVERNVAPATYPQTFSPPRPIRYVLEVNANAMSPSS